MTWDYREHLVRDPSICGGDPVVRGTRVTLRTILASLAEGATVAEILADFPSLAERVLRLFESESVEDWLGCFVVATDRKLRVRRS